MILGNYLNENSILSEDYSIDNVDIVDVTNELQESLVSHQSDYTDIDIYSLYESVLSENTVTEGIKKFIEKMKEILQLIINKIAEFLSKVFKTRRKIDNEKYPIIPFDVKVMDISNEGILSHLVDNMIWVGTLFEKFMNKDEQVINMCKNVMEDETKAYEYFDFFNCRTLNDFEKNYLKIGEKTYTMDNLLYADLDAIVKHTEDELKKFKKQVHIFKNNIHGFSAIPASFVDNLTGLQKIVSILMSIVNFTISKVTAVIKNNVSVLIEADKMSHREKQK